ncbi:hypothetical protein [Rubritalea tangerina]|uniref:hypothetical protein n=1 Tax=Rubritalea tangerina TaxID=430798 RepID=UPI00360B9815
MLRTPRPPHPACAALLVAALPVVPLAPPSVDRCSRQIKPSITDHPPPDHHPSGAV